MSRRAINRLINTLRRKIQVAVAPSSLLNVVIDSKIREQPLRSDLFNDGVIIARNSDGRFLVSIEYIGPANSICNVKVDRFEDIR